MLHYNGLSMSFMLHSWWSILTHATSCCPVACCAAGACWAPVTGSSPTGVMGRLDSRARPLSTMSSAMEICVFFAEKMGGFWSSKPQKWRGVTWSKQVGDLRFADGFSCPKFCGRNGALTVWTSGQRKWEQNTKMGLSNEPGGRIDKHLESQ